MGDQTASSQVIMATSGSSATVAVGTPKKTAAAKSKNPREKPTHPKTAEMVNSAIKALKERGGSSVQAIKKYMVGTYKVDAEKQATFIKKYLKAAVASGVLIQTKGKGAAGSFKLASTKAETTKPKVKPAPKTAALVKKSAAAKKAAASKKLTSTAAKKMPTKKAAMTAVSEKKNKVSKGPAAKPPKSKTTKAKPASKSPAKTKPMAAKKIKSAVAKPKKAASKKTPVVKK